DSLPHVGEGLHPARAVWAELAIVLGPDLALDYFFDVAAGSDPVAAKLGQSSHDVDAARRVGVRPAGVVEDNGRLARRRFKVDSAHGDAQPVSLDMNLPAAADRPGGDFKLGACGRVAHRTLLLPTPVSAGSGSMGPGVHADLSRS